MPSTTRRGYLAALGTTTTAGLAGCAGFLGEGSEHPPAGSLRLVNDDTVPHTITMRVTDIGAAPGDDPGTVQGEPETPVRESQRELSAATAVEPDESRTYETVFEAPVWYAVGFTLDGREPEDRAGRTAFAPAPTDGERGSLLGGRVAVGGEFSWVVTSTDDPGPFEG
jgi:hypothetical protein